MPQLALKPVVQDALIPSSSHKKTQRPASIHHQGFHEMRADQDGDEGAVGENAVTREEMVKLFGSALRVR